MKAIICLSEPEERLTLDIGAWERLMFERHAGKHGVPAMATRDAARQMPETYMCIVSYYGLRRRGLIDGLTYEAFEARWDGVEQVSDMQEDSGLTDPTTPAR